MSRNVRPHRSRNHQNKDLLRNFKKMLAFLILYKKNRKNKLMACPRYLFLFEIIQSTEFCPISILFEEPTFSKNFSLLKLFKNYESSKIKKKYFVLLF